MNKEEFFKILLEKANKIGINLTKTQLKQFYDFMNLLIEWNKKINLTAITDPKEIILKHFIDSLTIYKYTKEAKTLVDVGTGAGFPGIPIKIVNNDIEITLLDSLNKRINFLNEVISQLGLKNITTVHARVEEFGKNKIYREKFDIATSRAVANLSTLSEYMIPLLKVGGRSICMKGSDVEEELENSKKALNVFGGKVKEKNSFNLPETEIKRNIIVIEKVNLTPAKYPRKAGTPTKEPI